MAELVTNLQKIVDNKAALRAKLTAAGVTVPTGATVADMIQLITIGSGGGDDSIVSATIENNGGVYTLSDGLTVADLIAAYDEGKKVLVTLSYLGDDYWITMVSEYASSSIIYLIGAHYTYSKKTRLGSRLALTEENGTLSLTMEDVPLRYFDDLSSNVTADQVAAGVKVMGKGFYGAELITGTHICDEGVTLPTLTNAAAAGDVRSGKQFIMADGTAGTGTLVPKLGDYACDVVETITGGTFTATGTIFAVIYTAEMSYVKYGTTYDDTPSPAVVSAFLSKTLSKGAHQFQTSGNHTVYTLNLYTDSNSVKLTVSTNISVVTSCTLSNGKLLIFYTPDGI